MPALAILQARLSSTRLPGKVLADVGGEPMLALLTRRLRRARQLRGIVLATSDEPSDDELAAAGEALVDRVVRGPLDDVLGRFVAAAGDDPGPFVRITGDCPLIDPAIVDALVGAFESEPGARYGSDIDPERTFPDGLDAEIFTRDALLEADALARTPEAREHVTVVMRADPERFPAVCVTGGRRLGHLRWTVDRPDDLEFVRAVVDRLGDRRYDAGMEEILEAVRREPSLAQDGLRG